MLSIILINNAKGCLAQSVRLPGGTPQVLSSTPHGNEFQAKFKKIPSSVPITKALVGGTGPILTWATESHRVMVGAGVRGFSRPGEKVLLLICKL